MDCKCGNTARYINELGELCCGICPLKERLDSIKLADVPRLLAWSRRYLETSNNLECSEELKDIVQRKPSNPCPKCKGNDLGRVEWHTRPQLNWQCFACGYAWGNEWNPVQSS